MCGVIYIRSKNKENTVVKRTVNKAVLKQFLSQKDRGTLGFGIFDNENKKLVKETTEHKIIKYLRGHSSSDILFHHRQPTSTKNVRSAAHPFSTQEFFGDVQYILIHNGIVHNSSELLKKHAELGIVYQSTQPDGGFNDSEALTWEVALYLQGVIDKIDARGSVAFICIEKHKDDPNKDTLYWYRNSGSPLVVCDNSKFFSLASEARPQQQATTVIPGQLFHRPLGDEKNFQEGVTTHETLNIGDWSSLYEETHSPNYLPAGAPELKPHIHSEVKQMDGAEQLEKAFESKSDDYTRKIIQKAILKNQKKMADDIKSTICDYLNTGNGYYELAIKGMEERIGILEDRHITDYRDAVWYESEVLKAARGVLLADPFWEAKKPETKHPLFANDEPEREPRTNEEEQHSAGESRTAIQSDIEEQPVSDKESLVPEAQLSLDNMDVPSKPNTRKGRKIIESLANIGHKIPISGENMEVDFSEGTV